jgi:hypothetical protein
MTRPVAARTGWPKISAGGNWLAPGPSRRSPVGKPDAEQGGFGQPW